MSVAQRGAGRGRAPVAPATPPSSTPAARWLLGGSMLLVLVASLVLYELAARHLIGGNSDGATVVLEGQSIAHGNVTLSGWTLSLDSFWTIDAPFYAVAVAIAGVRPVLLTTVPVVLAALVLLLAMVVAQRGLRPRGRAVAVATVAVLLLFPGRELTSILLQGPLHVGTLLYCLGAFTLLSPARFGVRWAGAVALLAAALLGDLQSLVLAVIPIALCSVLAAGRARSWRGGLPLGGAAVASAALAVGVRELLHVVGGFLAPRANSSASPRQMLANIGHVPGEFLSVLGVTSGPFGPSGVPLVLRLLHLVGVAVIAGGVLGALARTIRSLPRAAEVTTHEPAFLEELLALAFLADLATLVILPISNSDAYSRYATAGVVFGVVLGARALGRLVRDRALAAGPVALVGTAALALYAGSFAFSLGGPAIVPAPKAVTAFLAEHRLVHGVGDYWSSSIVTVDSGGAIQVRPVILDDGRLVRYEKQSAADWYDGQRFDFYVFNGAAIWNGDTAAAARRTFGRPSHRYLVGSYEILTFAHPFRISPVGSDGP